MEDTHLPEKKPVNVEKLFYGEATRRPSVTLHLSHCFAGFRWVIISGNPNSAGTERTPDSVFLIAPKPIALRA
jgi:hypothetical protein